MKLNIFKITLVCLMTGSIPSYLGAQKKASQITGEKNSPKAPNACNILFKNEGMVANDGLWLTRKRFGFEITPKIGGLKIYKGYIFVSWYQGGMNNRSVWLSRKKIDGKEWKHIQFPHRHVLFRGDKALPENKKRGDSHNNIAIGICPKDDTLHLLYDMHAYQPKDFKNDYFNYRYTRKGGAIVPDNEWNIGLFSPKQNYLNKNVFKKKPKTYYRVTYPGFFTTKDGDLIAKWRIGGHTAANMYLTKYNGSKWSKSYVWNDTKGKNTVGFYGVFNIFNDRMYACWHRRSVADHKLGYINNRGLYLAYCQDETGLTPWYTAIGKKVGFPLSDLDPFKIADPSKPGQKMSKIPSFVITKSGAFHARVNIDNKINKHYYRLKPTDKLKVAYGIPLGDMYSNGKKVFIIGLENGRPVIKSAIEGTNNWQTEFKITTGKVYSHGISAFANNTFYLYLMERKPFKQDCRPIYVLSFKLNK